MDADERQYLEALCPMLSDVQLDDAESMHNNLEVLLDKIISDPSVCEGHIPGLEVHMSFLLKATIEAVRAAPAYGQAPGKALRNCLWQVFMFGYETGRVNWPLKKLTCEEAHG